MLYVIVQPDGLLYNHSQSYRGVMALVNILCYSMYKDMYVDYVYRYMYMYTESV